MDREGASVEIGMSVVRGCLLVPIPGELHDETVLGIQSGILKKLEATGVKAVIIDLSAVRVLDTFAFEAFAATVRMASLLGATTVLAGVQPGVASALIDLAVPVDGLRTAVTLEAAFQQLEARPLAAAESEEVREVGAEAGSAQESEDDDDGEERNTE
jgi:rsbT antagonist protein RsbS